MIRAWGEPSLGNRLIRGLGYAPRARPRSGQSSAPRSGGFRPDELLIRFHPLQHHGSGEHQRTVAGPQQPEQTPNQHLVGGVGVPGHPQHHPTHGRPDERRVQPPVQRPQRPRNRQHREARPRTDRAHDVGRRADAARAEPAVRHEDRERRGPHADGAAEQAAARAREQHGGLIEPAPAGPGEVPGACGWRGLRRRVPVQQGIHGPVRPRREAVRRDRARHAEARASAFEVARAPQALEGAGERAAGLETGAAAVQRRHRRAPAVRTVPVALIGLRVLEQVLRLQRQPVGLGRRHMCTTPPQLPDKESPEPQPQREPQRGGVHEVRGTPAPQRGQDKGRGGEPHDGAVRALVRLHERPEARGAHGLHDRDGHVPDVVRGARKEARRLLRREDHQRPSASRGAVQYRPHADGADQKGAGDSALRHASARRCPAVWGPGNAGHCSERA